MILNRLTQAAALAALLLAAGSGAAWAANATMTDDANVYAKASTKSQIVNEVYEDDDVTVTKCVKNFCFLKIKNEPDGWVRSKYLVLWDDEDDDFVPQKKPGVSVCLGNPVGGICINGN